MAERTADALAALRAIVSEARAVPMSASCMVNRAEVLELIDAARSALRTDLAEASELTGRAAETLARAEAEAAQIVTSAEERAAFLVAQSAILTEARRKAAQLEHRSVTEAAALRREADAYVDSRIAAFEAGLAKTMSHVQTMRARLATRSGLDGGETQGSPRVPG